ncbi:MAG: hypothetical protein U0670_02030 [Anaerolineae bacterium]
MRKSVGIVVLLIIMGVFGASSVLAAGATWTLVSVDTIGCASSATNFSMQLAGITDPSNLYWRTIVDAGGNRYMDEDAGTPNASDNGPYSWSLYNSSSGGPVTSTFPLPSNTPITVQLLLVDGSSGTPVSGVVVTFDKCNGGSVVSVEVISVSASCPYPLPTSAVVHSVPQGAPAFYAADASTATGFNIPAGNWYVMQTSGDFSRLWIACQASPVWVPSNAVAP